VPCSFAIPPCLRCRRRRPPLRFPHPFLISPLHTLSFPALTFSPLPSPPTMDSPTFVPAPVGVASRSCRRAAAACTCRRVPVAPAAPRMADGRTDPNADAPTPPDADARAAARELRKNKPKSNASWANNFLSVVGVKGAGSIPGWDLRPVSLREASAGADTKESSTCTYCKGTGRTRCTFCMGLTSMGPDGKPIPCPGCGGETTMTCSTCFGSTKQIELKGQWWKTGIDTLFK